MAMSRFSFTQDELEVASILLEVPALCLRPKNWCSPIDGVRWGAKRRRTEPPYRLKDENAPIPPVQEERRKKEETASPSTPLSFPTSGGEEPIVAPPAKEVKKPTRHKEWVKEKKEMVAALSERKADLLREIGVVKEKFQQLQSLNSFLREQKPKLNTQKEEIILHHILQPGPSQFDATWTAPQPVVLGIERPVFNFDLNVSPSSDDMADLAMLTWQSEPLKTPKELRRERLEKTREKYRNRISSSPSTSQKRPRVR